MILQLILYLLSTNTFLFNNGSIQSKIVYIDELYNINNINQETLLKINNLYKDNSLLIFKNIKNINQINIKNFLLLLNNNSLDFSYNYKSYEINPNYQWKNHIMEAELASIYIINEPYGGNELEFISTDDIYNKLTNIEKIAAENLLICYNYFKLPLVSNDNILFLPSLFNKVCGWNSNESNYWLNYFMKNKVLSNKFSIKLNKNDLCIYNPIKFIYSFCPYTIYFPNRGLLLSSFLKNKENDKDIVLKKLLSIKLDLDDIHTEINAAYYSKWVLNKKSSFNSCKETQNYYKNIKY